MHPTPLIVRLACLLLLTPAACRRSEPAPAATASIEVTGTVEERVAGVRKQLTLSPALAATIRDAHAVADRIGDGRLGPSDFQDYQLLQVAPADIAQWRAALTPLPPGPDLPHFTGPMSPVSWWVDGPEFASLEFFSAQGVTGRTASWIGLHAASGRIYVHSFTQ